jgi:hypothetical protein
MLIYLSLLVSLLGLLIYALASSPKAAEVGRLMFACGLLVFLLTVVGATSVTLGRRP